MTSGTVMPYKYTTLDKSRISAIFKCNSNSVIRFGYNSSHASIGDTTENSMLVCEINSSTKTLKVYRWNWSGTYTDLIGETTFEFDLTDGNYVISVEKDTIRHLIVSLFNADCPRNKVVVENTVNFSATDETKSGYCRCWGCGRFTVVSGSVTLQRFNMYATGKSNPKIYIVGDSYVEQAGRNPLCGWGQRLQDYLNGDVVLSGRGGAVTSNVRKRIWLELGAIQPTYCILEVGMNDSVTSSLTVDNYKESIQELIEIIEAHDVIPVLTTIPRREDTDNQEFIAEINPWIKSLNYKVIDEAMVMSTGDGITRDLTMYQTDKIHPTIACGEAVFDWIKTNIPELLY